MERARRPECWRDALSCLNYTPAISSTCRRFHTTAGSLATTSLMSRCTFSAPKSTRSATRNEAYHIIRDRCSDVFGLTDSLGLGTRVWSLTWPLDHEDRLRHWLLFCRLRCHYRGSLRVLPKTERSCEMRRRHRARSDRVDDRCPVPYWPGQFVANRHSLRWRNYRSGRCRRRSNWRSVSWSEHLLSGWCEPLSVCLSSATNSWPRATVTSMRHRYGFPL